MDNLYSTSEAAKRLRLSIRTLERHRMNGTGPYFIREGSRVYYRQLDLKQWQEDNRTF